ncbi:hypothetical protein RFI_29972 [Reticulomyxa filosa]|uniref:Protein kinase domain-containing protein n=1 Tax=Reticulomyxa filosa TaxID=46433 RepID=X6M0P3_RETFI|nr:hypothetical protein RFI_29972 [Reticulomyxa filosa]|eukprot:ETO07424.1 hypothetical protein RFI_29972 [Reticulomyxa filosa]
MSTHMFYLKKKKKEGQSNRPFIKLIDFGSALEVNDQIRLNYRTGKIAYFPPEVLCCFFEGNIHTHTIYTYMHAWGGKMDNMDETGFNPFKADMWCLGVCLWMLLFKIFPFPYLLGDKQELVTQEGHLLKQMDKQSLLPMLTRDAFDVLNGLFQLPDKRISSNTLIKYPFCSLTTEDTKTAETGAETEISQTTETIQTVDNSKTNEDNKTSESPPMIEIPTTPVTSNERKYPSEEGVQQDSTDSTDKDMKYEHENSSRFSEQKLYILILFFFSFFISSLSNRPNTFE